jgi:hypothetical protein
MFDNKNENCMYYKTENITGKSKIVFQVWLPFKATYFGSPLIAAYQFFSKKNAITSVKKYNKENPKNKIKCFETHKIEYIELVKDIEIV